MSKLIEYNSTEIKAGTGVARNHCAIAEPLVGGKSLVPSMERINKKKKDFTAMSFFAGCGGASIGMKMAGFNVLYANEFIPAAQDTYRLNHPDTLLDPRDIRKVCPKKLLKKLGLKRGELDHLDLSPPCFAPGTMIHTNHGFKRIEDVVIGDNVLTHTQEFHPVYDTMVRNYSGRMYRLKTMGSMTTEVTPEHPYYVRRKKGINKYSLDKPIWVEAQNLQRGDYVGIAVNQLNDNNPWCGFSDIREKRPELRAYRYKWKSTHVVYRELNALPIHLNDFWWVVGRFVGDGWITHKDQPEHRNPRKRVKRFVRICCDKTDGGVELRAITSRLDACNFSYKILERRTAYRISLLKSRELCEFLLQFGQGAKNKRIPGSVLSMPKSLLLRFIQGYISADGSRRGYGKFRFNTVSRELAIGIVHCINKVFGKSSGKIGCISSEKLIKYGCGVIEGRKVNVSDRYGASFNLFSDPAREQFIQEEANGIIWVPVRSIEEFQYKGRVYNMSVENDETYTANNLIVHNCKGFSTAGVQEDGWNKEVMYSDGVYQRVDDLFGEGVRMLIGLKPKTFLAENVAGLIKGSSRGMFIETLNDFKACGYRVKAALIDPVVLGAPQTRERMIFIGVRNDLKMDPVFPTLKKRTPVRVTDVLPHIRLIKTKVRNMLTYVPATRPSPTIVASDFDTGENASFSCGGWCEDDLGRRRKYNLSELRRLMCFPDDFKLSGTPRQQWERLGRSHLPLQVYHLTKAVRTNILEVYYDSKGADYSDTIK
jgi:site-specific DNA-cytosine methylase